MLTRIVDTYPSNPHVTVIVPVYRDWTRLCTLLLALEKQTYAQTEFEVVVVNNDPSDDMPPYIMVPKNAVVVKEENPGSYSARNKGISIAKGEIIAFTDSDCIPSADWLAEGISCFNKDNSLVGGSVEVFAESNPPTIAELYDLVFAFKQESNVRNGNSVTANLFVKRTVFDQVGMFNSNLFSGGDTEWTKRATSLGFKIAFASRAVVRHPARKNMLSLFQKKKRVVGGLWQSGRTTHLSILKGVLPPARALLKVLYADKLSAKDKFLVYSVSYLLKIYGSWCLLCLYSGLHKPERR